MQYFRNGRKSGQAIIFLIMVLFIGLFVVLWNFDLNRIIGAKFKIRNMGDSAALAAARWQGYSLNMIGEMNLIQVAIMTDQISTSEDPATMVIPAEVEELMELRARLSLLGPLTSFVAAQQAAFNNGAFHDEDFEEEVQNIASELENFQDYGLTEPYPDAYAEMAELLVYLSGSVAAGSYTLELSGHELEQVGFYAAISQAARGSWCMMKSYRYLLESYTDYTSWSYDENYLGDSDFFKLKVSAFTNVVESTPEKITYSIPSSSLLNSNYFLTELEQYVNTNETVESYGDPDNFLATHFLEEVAWHIYDYDWRRTWPTASISGSAGDGEFPFYADVMPEFNYLGAESGITMDSSIYAGIVQDEDAMVDLSYKTKAKAFGYLNVEPTDSDLQDRFPDNRVTPNYFGFVLPAFREVRLVHSDIGDKVLDKNFYMHVKYHLPAYISEGLDGLDGSCGYCALLEIWEGLDREAGLEWIEWAETQADDPCYESGGGGGGGGGGASGGS